MTPRHLALERLHGEAVLDICGAWQLPACYPAAEEEGMAVAREYEAARSAAAVCDLSDRALLLVSGPLRQKFLHGLISNDLAGRGPGEGCRAALMDAKGHLLALLRTLVTSDSVLLETDVDNIEAVERLLTHYRVAAPVRFAARPTTVLGLIGPQARQTLADLGAVLPELPLEAHREAQVAGHAVRIVRAGDLPSAGYLLYTEPDDAAEVWCTLVTGGARPLGRRALEALRIEQGRPWYGRDVSIDNLLHETGLVKELHSSTKGCYVGQEVIARLEARGGHVNKMLRGLLLTSPIAAGADVEDLGKVVGRVTSSAVSPRLGPIALGYVHRSRAEPGTELRAGNIGATVTALPFPG